MRFRLDVDGESHEIAVTSRKRDVVVEVDGVRHPATLRETPRGLEVRVGRRTFVVAAAPSFAVDGLPIRIAVTDIAREAGAARGPAAATAALTDVRPPMPGRVVDVRVTPGDPVHRGQPLLVLEAMKMQNEIASPTDGVVDSVQVTPGQTVDVRQVLVTLRAS